MTDVLLGHAYFLKYDLIEQRVMKPYPPLGILYLSAYLKRAGFGVEVFDATFRDSKKSAESSFKRMAACIARRPVLQSRISTRFRGRIVTFFNWRNTSMHGSHTTVKARFH